MTNTFSRFQSFPGAHHKKAIDGGGGGGEGAPAAAPAGVPHACCGEKRPNTFFIFCLCTGVNVHNEACALGPLIN